jgi:glycosyltransferase involved in cell wall biosynthesis
VNVAFESKRIVLLTPGHVSTNPRLVKEADALAEAGYDVNVIAADFITWAQQADRSFTSRPWKVEQTLPFGPLAPLSRRIVQHARQRLARIMIKAGVRQETVIRAAWHPIAPDLVAAAQRHRADLYIAHYPAALPAAAIAARNYGRQYAFDAEDFHPGNWPDDHKYASERSLLRAIEGRYLEGCAYVTAASPGIADAYTQTYRISRPTVVLNVFPRMQAPCSPTPAGVAAPAPSVYWFSQTIGPNRGLECLVRAIARTRSQPHIYLRGVPATGFLEQLLAIAAERGVTDRIHVLPPAIPSEMERLAAAYDVGFSGEPGHTANNRRALGNKLFSYILAGVPIVMSDVPAHHVFAAQTGGAVYLYKVDDADDLSTKIDKLLCNPEALAVARAVAFHLGQTRFNWEMEKKFLLSIVSKVLSRSDDAAPTLALGVSPPSIQVLKT